MPDSVKTKTIWGWVPFLLPAVTWMLTPLLGRSKTLQPLMEGDVIFPILLCYVPAIESFALAFWLIGKQATLPTRVMKALGWGILIFLTNFFIAAAGCALGSQIIH